MATETMEIASAPTLDRIHVFWMNEGPGQGYVTIICYGCAWTAFFGGMSGRTIQQFFAAADVGYLVNKLGTTQFIRPTKRHEDYLGRVIVAVKKALEERPIEAAPSAACESPK